MILNIRFAFSFVNKYPSKIFYNSYLFKKNTQEVLHGIEFLNKVELLAIKSYTKFKYKNQK